jgi:hypothetical protein
MVGDEVSSIDLMECRDLIDVLSNTSFAFGRDCLTCLQIQFYVVEYTFIMEFNWCLVIFNLAESQQLHILEHC